MINIGKILKRSLEIFWRYRVLWLFGLLLALTVGSSTGSNNRYTLDNSQPASLPQNAPAEMKQLSDWFIQDVQPVFVHPEQHIATLVNIGLIALGVCMLFCLIASLVRYPAETAVIRMVDDHETTGTKMKFKQGWKLGWNRRALRMWVIDLILYLPLVLVSLGVAALGLNLYIQFKAAAEWTATFGVVASVSLGALLLLVLITAALFVSLLRNFFIRVVALDDQTIKAAFKAGWQLFKTNLKSAGLMWLVMCGIAIAMNILETIVFYLLIPAYLILLVPAALVAVLPGLIGYGISSIFASGAVVWVASILSAVPFFFVVLFSPLFMVIGWYEIFQSSVWTLTYRELKARESLTPPALTQSTPAIQ